MTREAWKQLDIRFGRILSVETVPKARRPSYKLELDFGPAVGKRTSVAGLVEAYPDPASLLNRLIFGVLNLGSRRVAGIVSQALTVGFLDPKGTYCVRLLNCPELTQGEDLLGTQILIPGQEPADKPLPETSFDSFEDAHIVLKDKRVFLKVSGKEEEDEYLPIRILDKLLACDQAETIPDNSRMC